MKNNYIENYSNILIAEPNKHLSIPYCYVPSGFRICRTDSIKSALKELSHRVPDIAFISSSFPTHSALILLEAIKNCCLESLIPLIIVIDISNKVNFVPGVNWGGKIAIIDSLCTKKQFDVIFERVLKGK